MKSIDRIGRNDFRYTGRLGTVKSVREQEARMNQVYAPTARPSEAATPAARRASASITVLTQAELAECACPDFCERDHDRD